MYDLKDGNRRERVSWIAALKQDKLFAPLTFEGSCNRRLVEQWLEESLLPQLNRGDVIVMDNASFHKAARIQQLIEQAGCHLIFLPPYSPDLNKIEKFWARLKHFLSKTMHDFDCLWDAVDHAFRQLS